MVVRITHGTLLDLRRASPVHIMIHQSLIYMLVNITIAVTSASKQRIDA